MRSGYIHRLDAKRSIQALAIPRFMGDGKASFSNSLQLGGMLLYEKKKNERLTWRAGLLYNQEFFGPYFVPLFYLDWEISSSLKYKGLFPIYGALSKTLSSKWTAGLHYVGLTTTYRIGEQDLENYYMDRRSLDLSFFGKYQLTNTLFLETRLGYSLTRDYGLYADGDTMDFGLPLMDIGDTRTRLNDPVGGSPFFQVRLWYSIPID